MAGKQRRMGLDDTLENLNRTVEKIVGLLEVVQISILIVALALAVLLVGMTCVCYYSKYKKYNRPSVPSISHREKGEYAKGEFHPSNM